MGNGIGSECDGTVVVNVRKEPCDVYIGRAMPGFKASRFANPYRIGADGSRAQVLARYREHLEALLERDPAARQDLEALRGKRLGCWCKPEACHGDILVLALQGRLSDTPSARPAQTDLFCDAP